MSTELQTSHVRRPSSTATAQVPTIRVHRLGRMAAAALRSESRWEVVAVFRRSFYCRSGNRSLVCFGPTSLGDGPVNVLAGMAGPSDWETAGLAAGDAAACDGHVFLVGERCAFLLTGADTWHPDPPVASWDPTVAFRNLVLLVHEARSWPTRGGLQVLVSVLLGTGQDSASVFRETSPLVRMARPHVASLAEWLETGLAKPRAITPVPVAAVEALVGLGPGLTPSGDDFLGGALIALRHFGAARLAHCLAAEVLRHAECRTHAIGRAHLAAAAEGEGLAPLHATLSRLCAPAGLPLREHLSAVDAIGHTSGWDALVGIVLVASIAARVRTGDGGSASPLEGPAGWGMHVA